MNFKAHAKRVCGLDPDPRVVDNPYLHEAKVGLGERIPWPDGTFDVIADNVGALEPHVFVRLPAC